MSTGPVPTVGRIVHYKLTGSDVARIIGRRTATAWHKSVDSLDEEFSIFHGNRIEEGDVFPMIITRVWGDAPESAVNGQVFLDGDDILWATSTCVGDHAGMFTWPGRT